MAEISDAIDFQLGTAAAPSTEVDYSASVRTANWDRVRDILEANVFGTSSKRYVPGLSDATFTVEFYYSTALEDAMHDLLEYSGVDVDFRIGVNGTVTGQPRYAGQCLISKVSHPLTVGDVKTISCDFQVNSAITRDTYP